MATSKASPCPLLVPLNNIKEHLYIRSSTLLQLD
jgi:hypothetical protein